MRIQELDLKRYGKFTDQRLEFPPATRDFHLIVGANEAGKSTTRQAILDLLFGIETRSSYDFLHAKADMCLGACLEQAGQRLQFERSKARAKSLFDAQGRALPETALAAFLGSSERGFFDQMFGLDHGRMEAGGKAILSASNDLGQILFQSAAGIASLALVRGQLEAEADKLWAKRRAGDRAYYQASDELAAAETALKASTVRTKDWLEARARVEELALARTGLRARLDGLELRRSALERVRRVAPVLRQIGAAQAALDALPQQALLPSDAARALGELELAMAGAARTQELFSAQALVAAERLAAVQVDETLLRLRGELLALEQRRQQVGAHGQQIQRCRAELDAHRSRLEAEMRRLGWPQMDEAALLARLPALPQRNAFAALAKNYALLDQGCRHAAAAEAEKAAELQELQAQARLAGQAEVKLPASLGLALSQARALGDVRAAARREEGSLLRVERELQNARAGLGAWAGEIAGLRALMLPSEAALQQRLQRQADRQAKFRALSERQLELKAAAAALALEIAQYVQAHQPVGVAALLQARAERDARWQRLKQGQADIGAAAPDFEASTQRADDMADQRHAKAREASELQSKQDALARLSQQASDLASAMDAQAAERVAEDAEWRALVLNLGLQGMSAADLGAWRVARQRALEAQDLYDSAQASVQAQAAAVAEIRADLGSALRAAGLAFDEGDSLQALMALAADASEAAAAAAVHAQARARQTEAASRSLQTLRDKHLAAKTELAQWRSAWIQSLHEMGLPEVLTADAAEGVGAAMADMDAGLKQMRELRLGRIEPMQRELADFEAALAALLQRLGLAAGASADLDAQALLAQLARAQAAEQDALRLRQELAGFESSAAAAGVRLSEAHASLQPLLQRAGLGAPLDRADWADRADQAELGDVAELRQRIEISDRRRLELAALESAQRLLADSGDGLGLAALELEVAATDVAAIPMLVADLARQIADLQLQGEALAGDLNQAQVALALISGQDDAARAEGRRQDALAKMANAAERYVKVYTASRLLKWAIDRYRETKQGPLLGRAGAIFAALTLGAFQRLSVDFEAQPLTLHGLRADGRLVGVAGMSEGTRDQLFMALRLAALELHIGQDPIHALPFIADDLFINYDDGRAEAGLRALADLSARTQVIFLSHHAHLLPLVRSVFGAAVNVIRL